MLGEQGNSTKLKENGGREPGTFFFFFFFFFNYCVGTPL